jgi:D-3-phosphoglycerate dehydrogenase / 2-oxoglutarate reductase
MTKGKVLIAAPVHPVLTEGLTSAGYELLYAESITQDSAFGLISGCVGVITSTRLQMNKELIDAAPGLKWVGRMGSGMEVIDIPYATEKGISCYSSPEGNANSVAEHALGMLLSLTKRITWSHHEVKKGKWLREENRGTELEGKTIGIIGYGHTGKAFARKLLGFDMRVLVYDKYKQDGVPSSLVNCKDLQPIFEEADIVSFHVPLQQDTVHYFNDDFLNTMTKPFILINTSRGQVVQTSAVAKGVKEGKIAGVCFDVIEQEPLNKMDMEQREMLKELMQLPQIIVTPHIAGYSNEALYKMSSILLNKIVIRP